VVSVEKFDLLGPLDYRYIPEGERKKIALYLSENARVRYQALVEAAIVRVLSRYGVCSSKVAKNVEKAVPLIKAKDVYREERRIKHDVRALVNVLRSKVSNEAKPFIHFSATSYDIVDTSNSLRYKDAVENLLLPELLRLEKQLIRLSLKYRDSIQIGRTHGQHAEPLTFGFALAEYVARLGERIENIIKVKDSLSGKFSGAVGAYNAQSLLLRNPAEFEKKLMKELGLKPAPFSTQVILPEPYEDLQHALISCFTVLANFSDDMRNLQRSEINEVALEAVHAEDCYSIP
jgi:adenylosuccinate lyase